jgi:hypothetical protein
LAFERRIETEKRESNVSNELGNGSFQIQKNLFSIPKRRKKTVKLRLQTI